MQYLILSLIFTVTRANVMGNYRRNLVPKTLAQKLCEKDSTLTICSLPEVTPPKNPMTVWKMCEDQPHLALCRYQPPMRLPMLEMVEVTPIETVLVVEKSDAENRRALLEKVIDDVVNEKARREKVAERDDTFDDTIMLSDANLFEDVRLIKK